MTNGRALWALVIVQGLIVSLLLWDRAMPTAHAAEPVRCEITNWPGALTGTGFDTVRVRVEETKSPLPVVVKDWQTSDRVGVSVQDWDTRDVVRVQGP